MTIQPMPSGDQDVSEDRDDSLLMFRVATSHYQDRLSNLEIARALGISRFRVARLLEQATTSGVVQIKLDLPLLIDHDLSQALTERYNLRGSKVLVDSGDALWRRNAVSALAIHHLGELLTAGQSLGIAWGRTLDTVARVGSHLTYELPDADVVQLVGGVPSENGTLDASDLVRRFSLLTGGRSIVLNAPLVVPSDRIAQGLRAERSVAEALAAGRNTHVALFGVGAWQPDQSNLWNLLNTADRATIANAGTVADICGILIAEDGSTVDTELTGRTIGITLNELRDIPRRVAVIHGEDRIQAVAAVLRSGATTDLVLEAGAARALLDI
ncbi:sugar-binding transcriptional regulator [Microbacterium keratanolyticum]